MQSLTLNVVIATVVFFVVMLFWNGNGFGVDALWATAIESLLFAMIYAAIRVGVILFRSSGKQTSQDNATKD